MKVELVVDPTAPASFADRVGYVFTLAMSGMMTF